jgi:14-3-3 protein epsilon
MQDWARKECSTPKCECPSRVSNYQFIVRNQRQGDYYRYIVQFAPKRERDHYAGLSLSAYKSAYKHALGELEPIHPTRLGLALNFAVYYHDVLNSPDRACHLAKHAFDEAVQCLDQCNNSSRGQDFRDSLMILQLLRDDLILWASEIQKGSSIQEPFFYRLESRLNPSAEASANSPSV